jgi:Cytochrome P450
LYELAKNKEAQDKLREEINNAIPNDEALSYETVMNLEYLDQVWNGTLETFY